MADWFGTVSVTVPSASAVAALAGALVLLCVSGFASAAEIAFFSLTSSEREEVEERKRPSDVRIAELLEDKQRLLATILITNNLANVAFIILGSFFFFSVFHFLASWVQFGLLAAALSLLILLFGEIVPKMYASQRALAFCRFAAGGMEVCRTVFYPLASLMMRSTALWDRYVGRRRGHALSVDDLSHALELTDKTELSEDNNILERRNCRKIITSWRASSVLARRRPRKS